MSAVKRRCSVRNLDFENSVIANIRSKGGGRKKFRARITKGLENSSNQNDETEETSSKSSKQNKLPPEPTSPILIKKQPKGNESPVFFNKRKIIYRDSQESPKSTDEEIPSTPSSPVFKIKTKLFNLTPSQNKNKKPEIVNRMDSTDLFIETNQTSDRSNISNQIQDSTQESKQCIQISSVESEDTKAKSLGNYSVEMKESSLEVSRSSFVFDPHDAAPEDPKETDDFDEIMEFTKKNYKKNSLLGKLQKVLRRKGSEKLLWQHQNRKNAIFTKLVVTNFWLLDCNYILKCTTEGEITYLIVDSRWVPNVKKIKSNSVIQICPPWQQLHIKETNIRVLLSIICLEILEETGNIPPESTKVENFEFIPVEDFKTDVNLFIRSLFSSQMTGYLC